MPQPEAARSASAGGQGLESKGQIRFGPFADYFEMAVFLNFRSGLWHQDLYLGLRFLEPLLSVPVFGLLGVSPRRGTVTD